MRSDIAGSSIGGRSSRSQSISSEVPSGHTLLAPPTSVNPQPAYIAVSAASQLVSSEIEIDGASIFPDALAQLNSFLDNILFNILLAAKSTKLSSLRSAVYNVLKPRLGRAAVFGADEELKEYLGDDEDEDEDFETYRAQEASHDFDLELAWKLARLRCMVYSRLGDLEEDDEDDYIERENLDERGGRPRRFSSHPSRVPTASAIFLTSVIEFLAEQALLYAARATQRNRSKLRANQANQVNPDATVSNLAPAERIMVSNADMRHLGRDSPLQKLWRGWRHQVRMPTDPASPSSSLAFPMSLERGRKASTGTSDSLPHSEIQFQPSVAEDLHEDDSALRPLPMVANDIDDTEITGPSASCQSEHIALTVTSPRNHTLRRPRSLGLISCQFTPADNKTSPPTPGSTTPTTQSTRSRSLPTSPVLARHEGGSDIATRLSGTERSLVEDQQPRDITVGKDPVHGTQRQDSFTSYSLTESESKPANFSTPTIPMPGFFSFVKPRDAKEIGGEYASVRSHRYMHPKMPAVALYKSTPDCETRPVATTALGSHDSTTLAALIRNETYPPRTSLKTAGNSISYNQPSSSIPLDNLNRVSTAVSRKLVAPQLSPVQEMTRKEHKILEQSSSDTPITEARKRHAQVMIPPESGDVRSRASSKSSGHSHTKSPSSGTKLLVPDFAQPPETQVGSDGAGLQRVYVIPDFQEVNDQPSRSNPYQGTKGKGPGATSSQESSVKQGSFERASVDVSQVNNGCQEHISKQNEKKQGLETLTRSEETMGVNLTPTAMREAEAFDSSQPERPNQESAEFPKEIVSSRHVKPEEAEKKCQNPVEGMNGLRSNPPESVAVPSNALAPVRVSRPVGMKGQSPQSPIARSTRRSQHQPRDPKVERPSTKDLADFAKYTGPEIVGQFPKAVPADSARRTQSSAARFQARDPVVKGASSDLIDFIREGPPRGKGDGVHRIPRTVAPFRTTMDSDELSSLGSSHQDHAGGNSPSSNQNGLMVPQSNTSSLRGMVDPSNSSNLGAFRVSKHSAGEQKQPNRKQRRVRDPYAIENGSGDEAGDAFSKLSKYEAKYEAESLADFLRNTSPPPESQFESQPLLLSGNYKTKEAPNILRKPVHGGFRERLKRTASTNSLGRYGGAKIPSSPSATPPTATRSSDQVKPSSSHLIQSGSRFDSYKPTQATHASHVERNRQKDAAQALKEGKDEGNLSRFFTRKRRIAV